MPSSSSAALLSLVLLGLGACGGEPPPQAKEAPGATPADAPVSTPAGPEWEVATHGAETSSAEACDAARAAVLAEKTCAGSLCAHGVALAKEWADRCGKASTSADGVKTIATDLAERAKKPPTPCADRVEAILKDGCGKDITCEATAGRWAARCAKAEGSPLVIGLVTHVVAQKSALPDLVLDMRGCEDLRAEMGRGVACDHAACPGALKAVQTYRTRCEGDGQQPSAATIVVETAILAAAGQVPVPTIVKPDSPKLTKADMPVLLADEWGAIASVCDDRPADTAHYVASRRACEGGKVVLVRIFATVAKDVDVRAGVFDAPDDATFTRRFPTLRAAGEIETRDADAKQTLDADLKKAIDLAKDASTAPDAARALVHAVNQASIAIVRSAGVRATLSAADDAIAPALAVIAESKLAAAKGGLAGVDLAGLAGRAATRPFADIGEDGVVSIGAPASASVSHLDGAALLPHAMAAYTAALGDLATLAKRKPLSLADARDAKTRATDAAKACAAADKRARGEERDLIACAYAVNPCAPAKVETLAHGLDDDRATVLASHHTIDTSATALPAAAGLALVKASAICP